MRGLIPLLVLVTFLLSVDLSRHFPGPRTVPTFFVADSAGLQIALDGDWEGAGVFQNIDGLSLLSVIELTSLDVAPSLQESLGRYLPRNSGERFVLQVVDGMVVDYSSAWMSAAQRVTLGIPLHPDRMTEDDWDYLPGVGTSLASAIEVDRQINGDFLRLNALQRVRGIGSKRIKQWREFF